MSGDVITMAGSAVHRALELCRVMNREHEGAELYKAFRAVRHELETIQDLLHRFAADQSGARRGQVGGDHPDTSRSAAAAAMRTRSGSQRHKILEWLAAAGPLADFQVQEDLALNGNSQRPRRVELAQAGYVEVLTWAVNETLERPFPAERPAGASPESAVLVKHSATGMRCEVWRITPLGQAALAKLNAGQTVLFEAEGGDQHGNGAGVGSEKAGVGDGERPGGAAEQR